MRSTLLDGFVRALVDTEAVPAISLEMVDREGTILASAVGWRDLGSRSAVSADTRFEIGSISKSFLSIVLLGLAAEGRLGLDDLLTDHLPWFAVRTTHAPIRLRHLLQHTSGLIAGADSLPDDYAQAWELRHTDTGSEPGTVFHYSNAGYVLLGLVVEAVTGRTAADLVAERVLEPLRMSESTARITHGDRQRMATGYQPLYDDRPWLPGDELVPATWFEVAAADGNVAATAHDLGRYLRMLLGGGAVDGATVLGHDAFRELKESLAPGGEPSEHPSRYGLGVNVETIDGHTCLTHGGGMVGYASFVMADLDAGLGVAVLTNASGDSPIAELVARAGYDQVRAEREARSPAPLPGVDHWVVADRERYFGTYVAGDRTFRVEPTDEAGLTLSDDAGSGRLGRAAGRLACTHPGWRTFHHDLAGDGAGRTWTYGGLVLRPEGTRPPDVPDAGGDDAALVGHYRSYSPWYTSFRIVHREGALHLVAAGGVEGARDDPQLMPLAPGVYRIGAEPDLPERLVAGPVVGGRVISVSRDGCVYSRTFTP